jgi:hypothetical protein
MYTAQHGAAGSFTTIHGPRASKSQQGKSSSVYVHDPVLNAAILLDINGIAIDMCNVEAVGAHTTAAEPSVLNSVVMNSVVSVLCRKQAPPPSRHLV